MEHREAIKKQLPTVTPLNAGARKLEGEAPREL
jgi:hypothetical protein